VVDDRETVLGRKMNAENTSRKILVLGASGLIGRFLTDDLRARGFQTIGVARHLAPSQKTSASDLELPMMSMDAVSLARLIREREIDVTVNCLGVLQDGPGSDTRACIAISSSVCWPRSATAAARCGWSTSPFPVSPMTIAPPSAPPSARPSG
jgi:dTDP-4-dehydrorhamnose reductase